MSHLRMPPLSWLTRCIAVSLFACAGSIVSAARANEYQPVAITRDMPAAGFIVQYRTSGTAAQKRERAAELAKRVDARLRIGRAIAQNIDAMELDGARDRAAQLAVLQRLRQDPAVAMAALDEWRQIHAVPNDPLFINQWYLQANTAAAGNFVGAWDITTSDTGVVVAVLDTGVRYDHPELGLVAAGGRLLPGYDFIGAESDGGFRVANDGDGRDADASDPGDWISSADRSQTVFANCDTSNSSWHGTRVSGMIAAIANNSTGIAGGTWNARILPVRVLGKCGGRDSDILAGMRWAAGLSVPGVPDNPTPAQVMNLSLGSRGNCSAAYPPVLSELANRGVLVVSSAGNEGGPVSAPANCPGVLAVAALRHVGTKVGFSNLGPQVALGAPGGNCVNVGAGQPCLFSLDTTSNSGTTIPANNIITDQFNSNLGTSFSAPIVSAAAALMLSVNRSLNAEQLTARLREGTRAFPRSTDAAVPTCRVPTAPDDVQISECNCTTSTCGAGMLDALAAVVAARRPIAALALPATVSPGQDVALSASGSVAACGRTIASYEWTVVSASGAPPGIVGANTATATVTAPTGGSLVLRVVVTDDAGATDRAEVTIAPTLATTSAPAAVAPRACPVTTPAPNPNPTPSPNPTPGPTPSPTPNPAPAATSSGGGGGAWDISSIVLLCFALAFARRRQPRIE